MVSQKERSKTSGGDPSLYAIQTATSLLTKGLQDRGIQVYYPRTPQLPFSVQSTGELGIKATIPFHLGNTDVLQPGLLTVRTQEGSVIAATVTDLRVGFSGTVENAPTTIYLFRDQNNNLTSQTGYVDVYGRDHYSQPQIIRPGSPIGQFADLLLQAAQKTYDTAHRNRYYERHEREMYHATQIARNVAEIISGRRIRTDPNETLLALPAIKRSAHFLSSFYIPLFFCKNKMYGYHSV